MTQSVERAAAWMYRGVWGVLTHWFRVPEQPPNLPTLPGEVLQSFRPAKGFLGYLKLKFWVVFALIAAPILLASIAMTAARPGIGAWLTLVVFAILVLPLMLGYLAIHLRFDSTWYVLSQRSLRIRSGIWTISEATITFENIQNVTVESGPIERFFDIANVIVDTAGGGSGGGAHGGKESRNQHRGILAGVSRAPEIRQLILSRLSHSKVSGLGDESLLPATGWGVQHLAVLREIRDALR